MQLLFFLPIILASCAVPTAQNPSMQATENANRVKLEIPHAPWALILITKMDCGECSECRPNCHSRSSRAIHCWTNSTLRH